tara:strand:- start:1736 stop:2584 length:849 start_codon:yes stop_codon:yes gene_type:complete
MPNLKTIFPGLDPNDFGSGAAQVSSWAKGDDLSLIPSSKLPAIEIGNTFAFDALGDTESASLSEFYSETGNQYNKGDMAIVTVDSDGSPSVVTLIYVGTNQSSAGSSVAGDWRQIGSVNVIGGVGISMTGGTINNDLDIMGQGVSTPTTSGLMGSINFSDDFTITADGSDNDQLNISAAVHAPVAYNVTATSAADTSQTLVSNAVRVIPGATLTVTYTLPASPNVGDWVKLVNLSGRTDTIIARNAQPIQGSTSDLVLNDATANFELIYIDGTTGWALMGIN